MAEKTESGERQNEAEKMPLNPGARKKMVGTVRRRSHLILDEIKLDCSLEVLRMKPKLKYIGYILLKQE